MLRWIETPTDLLVILVPIVLWLGQIALCIYVRPVWVRLLPLSLCGAATVAFFVMIPLAEGLAKLGWLLLALWALMLVAVCALGWIVGGLARYIKKKRAEREGI